MATHDYVIANGTGAAVRSDLNDALAAIVSNNSGSSEPGTTYAYQWWADTTNNLLKLRNSANNAWITLRELDGTLLMEHGTASAPGLAFDGDLNTGIYRPAADAVGLTTGGEERFAVGGTEAVFNDPSNDVDFRVESNGQTHMLFVDAGNNRVGIGTASPGRTLTVADTTNSVVAIQGSTSGTSNLFLGDSDDEDIGALTYNHSSNFLSFTTNASEAARIDSAGRLAIGNTSASGSALRVDAASGTDGPLFDSGGTNNTNHALLVRDSASNQLFRVNNNGNIGIGSNAPLARLEVSDDAQSGVTAGDLVVDTTSLSADVIVGRQSSTSNDNTTFRVRDRTDNTILYASAAGDPFRVGRNGNELARIDTSGRLMVGTTSVRSFNTHASRFQVQGTSFSSQTASIVANSSDANGAYLFFAKQRSGAAGGNTIVQNGDLIGQLRFNAADGTDMETVAASMDVRVDGTPGSNDMPGRIEFRTTQDGASGTTERVRIDNKGHLTIGGASSDSAPLTVRGTQSAHNSQFRAVFGDAIQDSDSHVVDGSNCSEVQVQSYSANRPAVLSIGGQQNDNELLGKVVFYRSNNTAGKRQRAAIVCGQSGTAPQGGVLMFRTAQATGTSPGTRLTIHDQGKISASGIYSLTTTGGGPVYVEADGDLLRYTSSLKYKTDVETLEDARADAILNCRPVWYRSKCENDIKTEGSEKSDWGWYGFIAEEVAEIEPRLVNWATKDAVPQEDGSNKSVERDPADYEAEGVRYDNFVPLLVNLVKRQQAAIETLEAKVAALEAG